MNTTDLINVLRAEHVGALASLVKGFKVGLTILKDSNAAINHSSMIDMLQTILDSLVKIDELLVEHQKQMLIPE